MMKQFLDENFLLENRVSEELYHNYAAKMPIIDYHNHLSPSAIAKDHKFKTITEAWLYGDHYKWRAMRANGIDEKYITGNATDLEKFQKWAETVPYTLRNPLYHWTHLELRRYFGINELLSPDTATSIYTEVNLQLQNSTHTCNGLLRQMNVETLCTTDDPIDDLNYHKEIKAKNLGLNVLPTYRPDKAFALDNQASYCEYLQKLGAATNSKIGSLIDLLDALQNRVDYFHSIGGRIADHGMSHLPMLNSQAKNLDKNFKSLIDGKSISADETEDLQAYILSQLCKMYEAKGWTQQFHLGVIRNNNQRAMTEIGPDTGFDSMGDPSHGLRLSKFFDHLDSTNQLAKTILYNLNPRDNDLFATMAGNFNDGKIIGKMQFGTGWWFLDQKTGMENQINSLSNMGLLSRFVGMLTDSRSFLSFPRHEYFRRILCNLIGIDVVKGELPNDIELLGKMVEDICYNNAKTYFKFNH